MLACSLTTNFHIFRSPYKANRTVTQVTKAVANETLRTPRLVQLGPPVVSLKNIGAQHLYSGVLDKKSRHAPLGSWQQIVSTRPFFQVIYAHIILVNSFWHCVHLYSPFLILCWQPAYTAFSYLHYQVFSFQPGNPETDYTSPALWSQHGTFWLQSGNIFRNGMDFYSLFIFRGLKCRKLDTASLPSVR